MAALLRLEAKTLLAPAKINLTLEVLAPRSDGYHGLRSLVVPAALFDRIEITSQSNSFSFTSTAPELAEGNLVVRALERSGALNRSPSVVLYKEIPVGAGLGGGSSDAASILIEAMDGGFGDLGDRDWLEIARSLGSDVPLFLCRTAALVEGTGERVTALGAPPAWWAVIVHPEIFVSTREAYALLDRERPNPPAGARSRSRTIAAGQALQRADLAAIVDAQCNDFHEIICAAHPVIADAVALLDAAGARKAMLSGSGSAVFTLCADEPEARALVERLPPSLRARAYAVPFVRNDAWA